MGIQLFKISDVSYKCPLKKKFGTQLVKMADACYKCPLKKENGNSADKNIRRLLKVSSKVKKMGVQLAKMSDFSYKCPPKYGYSARMQRATCNTSIAYSVCFER